MAEPSRPHRSQGLAGTWAWPAAGAGQAGGVVPAGFGAWSSLIQLLRGWARAEAGAGRLLPWVPVAFGSGIAL
jgi:competence protein ComEC